MSVIKAKMKNCLEENIERERRFLVEHIPQDLEKYSKIEIPKQGYLAAGPDDTVVRIRQEQKAFVLTIKRGSGKERDEINISLTEEQFNKMWFFAKDRSITKTRYKIPYQDYTIELNFFHDKNEGLILAEVEFSTQEEMNCFVPPDWLGTEVTDDENYTSYAIAIKGIPKSYQSPQSITPELIVSQNNSTDLPSSKNVPEYEKEEGIARVVSLARKKMRARTSQNLVIEIAGGSASGKTSAVAKRIKDAFGEKSVIFSMDDYYRGERAMSQLRMVDQELNWDQPEAVDINLYAQHLTQLKSGRAIQKPVYNLRTGEREGYENFTPAKIIIAEGLFTLNDKLSHLGDIRIFVEIGFHGRLLRRILRDIERTGQKPLDILKYFSSTVEPMHEKHILSTRKKADFVIKNEYNPLVEASRSGLHEVQVKFQIKLSEDLLRSVGADYLGTTFQTDVYYVPKDRDLTVTDEMIRIRKEAGKLLLTYKGPRNKKEGFRQRPKFEFEIDHEAKKAFLKAYGSEQLRTEKNRRLYQLGDVVLSLDDVKKVQNKQVFSLGHFVEIRGTTVADLDKINSAISKLGLSSEKKIEKSYLEM